MKLHTMLVAAAVGLTTLTGCIPQSHSNVRQSNDYYYAARGRIENIEQISTGSGQASGVGMVGGAVVGGLLGNQIGKGSGKTVATIAGVAAGAYGGNDAEKYYSRNKTE